MKRLLFVLSVFAASAVTLFAQELPKSIKAGQGRLKARRTIHMPEKIGGYQLLKCDFHMHTIFSDGIVWPSLRIDEAWEEGLDAIAITEHIEGQPSRRGIEKGDHNLAYEIAAKDAARRNLILIRGAEITRLMPPGHLNALFVKDINALTHTDYMKVFEEAVKQGAFIFWNHPGWGVDSIRWYPVHETLYRNGWLHGIEVFNEFEWYPVALNWTIDKDLAIIGNTDVHDVNERLYDFSPSFIRPMTLVLSRDRTEEGIREALFAKRTFIYFFDTLIGKEEYLQEFFGETVEIRPSFHNENGRKMLEIANLSDVPYRLERLDASPAYPEELFLPAGRTIVVSVPDKEQAGIVYKVGNMLTGVDKYLNVRLDF
ncbi:MAG: hypothetical protein LBJ58_06550 [Tannerellaceae bacterium]|jgi:hypothetical protein|nr:hypothetical protein [Tannerellaceae bacterium]